MTVVYVKRLVSFDAKNRRESRAQQSQAARKLLATAVKREYGLDVALFREAKTQHGKPYLEGAPFCFNLSHSEGYAVVALSDREVGVDIERIAPISDKVMLRFLGKTCTSVEDKVRLWTRYESYGKMIGTGIPYPIDSQRDCFFKEYTELDYHFVTVCSDTNDFADHFILLDD